MDGGEREGGNLDGNWEGSDGRREQRGRHDLGGAPERKEGTTGWREWSLWGLGLSIVWFYKVIGF